MSQPLEFEELKELAGDWTKLNATIRKTTRERDRALWQFLVAAVKLAKRNRWRTRKKIRRMMRQAHPALDPKTLSRYTNLIRTIVRKKPKGGSIKSWVKSHGGIARCR